MLQCAWFAGWFWGPPCNGNVRNDPEPVLQRIACPLLILGAKDDPLMMPVPRETIAQNKHLILVETEDGGHMGWVPLARWSSFVSVHGLEWVRKCKGLDPFEPFDPLLKL